MIKRGSESFSGYNKPKRTPSHPKKSHAVLAKSGEQVKLIRFGQQGVKGSPEGSARNKSFKARHAKNIAKGKMSAAWWAAKTKWLILMPLLNGMGYASDVVNSGLAGMVA